MGNTRITWTTNPTQPNPRNEKHQNTIGSFSPRAALRPSTAAIPQAESQAETKRGPARGDLVAAGLATGRQKAQRLGVGLSYELVGKELAWLIFCSFDRLLPAYQQGSPSPAWAKRPVCFGARAPRPKRSTWQAPWCESPTALRRRFRFS